MKVDIHAAGIRLHRGFRAALLLRDASGSQDAHCALCGSLSDVLAAHVLPPQEHSDPFMPDDELRAVMMAAGLFNLYDTCNGFLLHDQCLSFFESFLWSVDSEGKVVMSDDMMAAVPHLAGFAGRLLFPDDAAVPAANLRQRPLPGLWAWHYQAYLKATAARQSKATATM